MKAIPFISTMMNENYRALVLEKFNHKEIESLFSNLKIKDMVGWDKVTDYEQEVTIEFHGKDEPYKIINPRYFKFGSSDFKIAYPQNLDQFICDCQRSMVNLYWNDTILGTMNRIFFMKQSEIENYNNELLTKIEKI